MSKKTEQWLENFWYHYKIPAMLAFAAVIFLTVVGIQFATKQSYDLYVLYAGPANINQTGASGSAIVKEMEKGFADISSQGELKTAVQSFVWVNDALFEEYKKNDVAVNAQSNRQMLQTAMDAIASGKSAIMLLDRSIFEKVRDMGALEKLSDLLGYVPDGALDEYGISLADTAFGRDYAGFSELPKDTVLCVRNRQNGFSLIGKNSGGEKWDSQLDVFRRMMDHGGQKHD